MPPFSWKEMDVSCLASPGTFIFGLGSSGPKEDDGCDTGGQGVVGLGSCLGRFLFLSLPSSCLSWSLDLKDCGGSNGVSRLVGVKGSPVCFIMFSPVFVSPFSMLFDILSPVVFRQRSRVVSAFGIFGRGRARCTSRYLFETTTSALASMIRANSISIGSAVNSKLHTELLFLELLFCGSDGIHL